MVIQEDPRANFLQLGAHLAVRIDSLISILTNIFSHLSPAFLQTTPLRSWLTDIILSSLAQSMQDTV